MPKIPSGPFTESYSYVYFPPTPPPTPTPHPTPPFNVHTCIPHIEMSLLLQQNAAMVKALSHFNDRINTMEGKVPDL